MSPRSLQRFLFFFFVLFISGKTYSMEGSLGSPNRGIVPRLVEHLFAAIEEADEIYEFVVKVSYVEIYLEKLRDLLKPSNTKMKIRESKHGVYIAGKFCLSEYFMEFFSECQCWFVCFHFQKSYGNRQVYSQKNQNMTLLFMMISKFTSC